MTADDLMALPTGMGRRYELIEGALVEMAAAGGKHGTVTSLIAGELYLHLKDHPIGLLLAAETGFYTRGDEHTVRAPDVAFIHRESVPPGGIPEGYLRIVPDLVVEVVSPGDRASGVDEKTQEWLRFGVREVWVVYPNTQRIMVYRRGVDSAVILNVGDTLDGGDVLPGFTCPIATFFAD
jgi:Uma2 family endonuclease